MTVVGIFGFIGFGGRYGNGSIGEIIGQPNIDRIGMLISILLMVSGACLVHWSDRFS